MPSAHQVVIVTRGLSLEQRDARPAMRCAGRREILGERPGASCRAAAADAAL